MVVLVVDDSLMARKNLKEMLEKLGHSVILATNGEQGLAMYEKEKPDLVTMDLAMPGISGIDALRHLIRVYPSVKVIMSTANSFSDSVLEAMKEGASGYILKPITMSVLRLAINKAYKDVIKEEVKEEVKEVNEEYDFFKNM